MSTLYICVLYHHITLAGYPRTGWTVETIAQGVCLQAKSMKSSLGLPCDAESDP